MIHRYYIEFVLIYNFRNLLLFKMPLNFKLKKLHIYFNITSLSRGYFTI